MSSVVSAAAETLRHRHWAPVVAHAPKLAVTAWRNLDQMALSLRPATIDVADNTLRTFAGYLVAHHGDVVGFADVGRVEVEGFKDWFAHHPNHIWPTSGPQHRAPAPWHVAQLLRAHHRMGLGRRPGPHTDLRHRRAGG